MQDTLGDSIVALDREHSVSTLIRNGEWDTDLISASFNPYIAGEILKIPLNDVVVRDSLFWKYDAKGRYTVKDGCRLQRGLFIPPTHQSVHPNEDWWSFIWNLSIPPKIHIFWWRISHDCIPTNQNLYRQHVPINESCSLCNFSMDSTSHALFFCAAIKHLWKNTMFTPVLRGGSHSCTLELCLWLKEQLSKADFENFATHTWAVWREKQNAIHRDKKMPLAADVTWSLSLLSDFRKSKNKEQLAVIPVKGRLLLAFGKQINQPLSVVHGELLAIREGILLIHDKGFTDVQVASDSLLAVQAVTTEQEDLGYIGLCATAIRKHM
ncbi:uncharacterized protein LOC142550029 [Primulina tabacum]|uniref:uncharacterized protein LOC142550029 n=1 Tax=Primulina tabacum TaxID=48773 RepID=UPI003F5ABE02